MASGVVIVGCEVSHSISVDSVEFVGEIRCLFIDVLLVGPLGADLVPSFQGNAVKIFSSEIDHTRVLVNP